MKLGRLFWKFFLAFWLALLVAGVGVGSIVWWHQQAERERFEQAREAGLTVGPRASLVISAAASVLSHGGVPALRGMLAEWPRERAPLIFVVDERGLDLFGRPVSAELLASARQWAASDGQRRSARFATTPEGQGFLLFIPAEAAERRFYSPRFPDFAREGRRGGGEFRPPDGHHGPPEPSLLMPLSAGLLASIGFSALLAWHLAKPVRNLRWALGEVAEGHLDTRVKPLMGRRRDEIADLGEDFDRMAGQLQGLVGAQRRLLHDVSHELRSPLARLQAAVGLARQDPLKVEATLERIERECGRLDDLVGQLLTLARLDAGVRDAPEEALDLLDMVAGIVDDARFEAEALGSTVSFEGLGEAQLVVRAELLQRAFENVVRNGVKYTQPGSTVAVRAEVVDGNFHLEVADRGPGVPEADLEAIFEPFYRGRNGYSSAGFGLGLAIARRALEGHGGRIAARNRAGGGLEMHIRLPMTPNSRRKE